MRYRDVVEKKRKNRELIRQFNKQSYLRERESMGLDNYSVSKWHSPESGLPSNSESDGSAKASTSKKEVRCAVCCSLDDNSQLNSECMDQLDLILDEQVVNGIKTFVVSLKDGNELRVAKSVLKFKEYYSDIHVVIVYPFEEYLIYPGMDEDMNYIKHNADMFRYSSKSADSFDLSHMDSWIVFHCNTIILISLDSKNTSNRLSEFDLIGKTIIHVIESQHRSEVKKSENKARSISVIRSAAGQKWTQAEEKLLTERFQRGYSIAKIAEMHNRNVGGIRSRLKKLGLIDVYAGRMTAATPDASVSRDGQRSSFLGSYTDRKIAKGLNAKELVILAEQVPGYASFENYPELKEYLRTGLSVYNNREYSIENIDQAREDLKVLKSIRKKLTDKKKALETAYIMPIETVLDQLNELIDMVKQPYAIIDQMIKANAKEIKRQDILRYAESKAATLGNFAKQVVYSSAFFNPRWCNASYKERDWKRDVDEIIHDAEQTIEGILNNGGEHVNVLLGFYFDKLSLNGVQAFLNTVEAKPVEHHPSFSESLPVDQETGEILETVDSLPLYQPEKPDEVSNTLTESDQIVLKRIQLTGNAQAIDQYLAEAVRFGIQVEVI